MRVVGASRWQVARAHGVEFLAMGILAGVLATVAAASIGELVAQRAFDMDPPANPWLWVIGPTAGLLLLSVNAWISARRALAAPPGLTLRD
jgi:putative ABC transport system permease protein